MSTIFLLVGCFLLGTGVAVNFLALLDKDEEDKKMGLQLAQNLLLISIAFVLLSIAVKSLF